MSGGNWRERDWSWWEPGSFVGYHDIHPDASTLTLELDGQRYEGFDSYCITPGCTCTRMTVGLYICPPNPEDEEIVGIAWLDYGAWRVDTLDPDPGWEEETEALASQLLADKERQEPVLRERHEEMQALGSEIAMLAARAHAPRAPRSPVHATNKAKPNEPCPCGSGKKYKACCMP